MLYCGVRWSINKKYVYVICIINLYCLQYKCDTFNNFVSLKLVVYVARNILTSVNCINIIQLFVSVEMHDKHTIKLRKLNQEHAHKRDVKIKGPKCRWPRTQKSVT